MLSQQPGRPFSAGHWPQQCGALPCARRNKFVVREDDFGHVTDEAFNKGSFANVGEGMIDSIPIMRTAANFLFCSFFNMRSVRSKSFIQLTRCG